MFSAEAQKPCPIDYALPGSSTLQQSNCSLEEQKKVINEGCVSTCSLSCNLFPSFKFVAQWQWLQSTHKLYLYLREKKKPMISSIMCEFDPDVVARLANINQAQ